MQLVQDYWPLLALALWLLYKTWKSQRIVRMLPQLKRQGAVLLDVRSVAEFAADHAEGSINIPLPELGHRLGELHPSVPVVVACASGTRSGMAKLLLKKNGFTRVHNVGTWRKLMS